MNKLKSLLCLCIAVVILGNNSCKKDEKTNSPGSNLSPLSLIANLPASQQIKSKELLDWFAANPELKEVQPQWSDATQTFYNGKQVIEVPVTAISGLFFTKVKGVLNVEVYKWYDKKPGDKAFSGNVTVISLQDYKLSAYSYINGQLQNSGYISLLNPAKSQQPPDNSANKVQSSSAAINLTNPSKTLRLSFTPKQLSLSNFFIDLGCWISGGTVIPGAVDGCIWGAGSIYDDIGDFLSDIFGGGGDSSGGSFGSYGAGSVGYTSSDGSSVTFTSGGGGMAYLTINNPCSTAPPPWYNGAGSAALAVRGPKTLVAQQLPNPCGTNYTSTQWLPIPVINTQQLEIDLENELDANPLLLIRCDVLQKFKDLESIKPPQSVIDRMHNLNIASGDPFMNQYYVQNINFATGWAINLDRFEIHVTTLPIINGVRDPSALLEYIRIHLNQFIDNSITTFQPYVDPSHNINDTNLWLSVNPTTAFLHLNIYGPLGTGDNGSVVVDDHTSSYWTVSTIRTPIDGNHPVTGNRRWGYDTNPDGTYTFYVTGADRITRPFTQLAQTLLSIPFDSADALWESYQSGVEAFINNYGGHAIRDFAPTKLRPDYQAISDYFNGKITLAQFKANHGCQ